MKRARVTVNRSAPRAQASVRVQQTKANVADSLTNLVTGLGTDRDKSTYTAHSFIAQDPSQLEAAYRGDWVARKVVNIPARDATREWRAWQADVDQIELLEAEEKRLGLQQKTTLALTASRLYGGAAIMIGVKGADPNPNAPLDPDSIAEGGVTFLNVVLPRNINTGTLVQDVLSPYYGQPEDYQITSPRGQLVKVHPSRVVRFVGEPLLDPFTATGGQTGWGDSVLYALDAAIKHVGLTTEGIATLVHEAKIDVIKLPGFMERVSTEEYRSRVIQRMQLANLGKSVVNALLMDKDEEWERITTQFSGLPDILKIYLLIASGAADIPATRMLGQSAMGLNATGDGDVRNYYDGIRSFQKTVMTPAMSILDLVIMQSALGAVDAAIHYEWSSLWQMDEAQRSEIDLKKAQTFKIDVDAGIFEPDVLREARVNQLIECGTYPGIEAAVDEAERDGGDDLDETDPNVQEQFEKSVAEPEVVEPAKEALNGAQITSLLEIASVVQAGELPPESAKAILAISFPSLSSTEIGQIVDPIEIKEKQLVPLALASRAGGTSPASGDVPGNPAPVQGEEEIQDAQLATMYVRRDVLNAGEIIKWAKEQGFSDTVPASEMHVTIAFSRTPVDWMKMGEDMSFNPKGTIEIAPGGPRRVEPLGPESAVVLLFQANALTYRHQSMLYRGASWDYDDYQPHITIIYPGAGVTIPNLNEIEPYRGPIKLGPEIFEEI